MKKVKDRTLCINCDSIIYFSPDELDPETGALTCEVCGMTMYDSNLVYIGERYPGMMWRCKECRSLLNKQPKFTDTQENWTCTQCKHVNIIRIK